MSVQQQQLLNLFLLLLLGASVSNLYLEWYQVIGILFFTLFFDFLIYYLKFKTSFSSFSFLQREETRFYYFPYASLSTAIGVMLMMVTPYLWIYGVVIAFALLQKHYLTYNGQHFFNPSNFALILGLLFFYSDAHIVLGQLGDELWLRAFLTIMALAILIRVDRWMIPLAFVGFYLLFQYFLVVSYDPVLIMEEIYYRFFSLSFVLFILFMLTDPRTTPSKSYQQTAFACLIALFSVVLDRCYGFRIQHLFLALFLFSLFTPLVEQWQNRTKHLRVLTFLLLLLAIMVIILIESKPPFYFTMDG